MAYVLNFSEKLESIPVDKREAMRYFGGKETEGEIMQLLSECISEVEKVLSFKVVYDEYPVRVDEDEVDLGFCRVKSKDLAKNLSGCEKAVVFAATLGLGVDRLILRYKSVFPTKAVCIGAVGSERAEALCDAFCDSLKERYDVIRPRFSAGYGDLALSMQKEIFSALDCRKNIGVSLSESMLMTPVKSVTAIVGVKTKGDN